MGEAKFYETEITASDATPVRFVYDQAFDTSSLELWAAVQPIRGIAGRGIAISE